MIPESSKLSIVDPLAQICAVSITTLHPTSFLNFIKSSRFILLVCSKTSVIFFGAYFKSRLHR